MEGYEQIGPTTWFHRPTGTMVGGREGQSLEDVLAEVEASSTEPIPGRRKIRKSTVQARLIDAGKMDEAYAALTSNPTYFARWFAPDHSEVYADDPDALALLAAIGADADAVMAPE